MSDATQGTSAPRPPVKEKSARRGFLGFGRGKTKGSPGENLIANLQSTLPETDDLRRARLQTHLFQGQLPAFPAPRGDEGAVEDQSMTALREQQQARADQRAAQEAAAAADPARQRADMLREQHRQERPRPASSLRPTKAVGRPGSDKARVAATRSQARQAFDSNAGSAPMAPKPSANRMNALVLLVMILTLAVLIAMIWYGYQFYQSLSAEQGEDQTPLIEQPVDPGPGVTVIEPPITDLPEPEPTVTVVETPDPEPTEAVSADDQRYRTAVFLLENELASDQFLTDSTQVDGVYDQTTSNALRELAQTVALRDLEFEVLAAGENPTLDQLERWYREIEPLF